MFGVNQHFLVCGEVSRFRGFADYLFSGRSFLIRTVRKWVSNLTKFVIRPYLGSADVSDAPDCRRRHTRMLRVTQY
jgi:hypothetical protein